MRKLLDILVSRPVEVIVGLLLLVMGGYAAANGADGNLRAWGGVLAGVGGVLLSWTTGTAYSRDRALAEADHRLLGLSRHLSTEIGNLTLTIEQNQLGTITAETCYALLVQSRHSLTGIVAGIRAQLGSEYDVITSGRTIADAARALHRTIDDVARALDRPTVDAAAVVDARRRVAEIARHVAEADRRTASGRAAAAAEAPATLVTETVACPACGEAQPISIGNLPGSTATTRCRRCHESFHVHRARSGAPFTRPTGTPSPQPAEREVTHPCTACEASITVRIRVEGGTARRVICTGCGMSHELSGDGSTLRPLGKYAMFRVPVVGKRNARPLVTCPGCGRTLTAIIRRSGSYFAACDTCRNLLTVPEADYRAHTDRDAAP
ncbi:hypothetical protein GCM10010123_27470 [Pilimelia anulata]|uniref:Uncharacterized protein n=1 Tax=Pilimelia anulata TaxID=53371 RepID=A0A8J3B809_9ACTN|nr:hypothetical protein [Pilimelia anulata]GGJ96041.1 hypothetical protein GCM10010123_27470 [Pilimelia anulata]